MQIQRDALAQVLAALAMVSQVDAMNLEPARPSAESPGGGRPPGGIDRRGDVIDEFRQKSVDHFRRRAAGCRTLREVSLVLDDAREALEAWQHTPTPHEPRLGDPLWKRWVADSDLSDVEVARRYSVSRQYVWQVRRAYRAS